jgi:hypothetical protein
MMLANAISLGITKIERKKIDANFRSALVGYSSRSRGERTCGEATSDAIIRRHTSRKLPIKGLCCSIAGAASCNAFAASAGQGSQGGGDTMNGTANGSAAIPAASVVLFFYFVNGSWVTK